MAEHGVNTQFDQELVNSTNDIIRSPLVAVQHWLQITQPSESASAAVYAHRQIVEELFPSLFSPSDMRRYYERLAAYESLIRIAIGEIGGKFYRDHLNHAVRTFLLAARLVKGLDIPPSTKNAVYFAALFHDVGYPLQEATRALRQVAESISATFRSLVVSQAMATYADPVAISKFVEQLVAWAKLRCAFPAISADEKFIGALLTGTLAYNHGVLGAYETWMLLEESARQMTWVQDALLAISFHDSKVFQRLLSSEKRGCVSRTSFPVLFFLILSDELQEWNRPVFLEDRGTVYPLERLSDVTVDEEGIGARLDYSSNACPGFSPLVQLADKVGSLARLDDCSCSIGLDFILPCLHYLNEVEVSGTLNHDLVVDFDGKAILADPRQEVVSLKVNRFSLLFQPDGISRVKISASYQQEYRTGQTSGERTVEACIRLTLPETVSHQLFDSLSASHAISFYINKECMELVLLLHRTSGRGIECGISKAHIGITEGNCRLAIDGVYYKVVYSLPRSGECRLKFEGERPSDPRLALSDKTTEYSGSSIPTHSIIILSEED